MSEVIGIKYNGEVYDLISAKERGIYQDSSATEILFDNSEDSLSIIRHSCAHLMAQAIKAIYPDATFFVGPVVEEGFYYDCRTRERVTQEDVPKIEKKMKEIAKNGYKIEKENLSRKEAEDRFSKDDLKMAVMSRIEGDNLSIYKQGNFEDLCRGPHLPSTKFLFAFKLTKLAGAYLGGEIGRAHV